MVKMWKKHFGVIFDFMPESNHTLSELVLNAKIICLKVRQFKIKTLMFQNVLIWAKIDNFKNLFPPFPLTLQLKTKLFNHLDFQFSDFQLRPFVDPKPVEL